MEVGGGTKIRKIILYLAMLWLLHWFISHSGVILGLWKMMYGSRSSEVCDGVYWPLIYIYRVSQEEWIKLRESVPQVKVYRYNPKQLYPKLNGYGDNGQRKLWSSCGSTYCTCPADAVSWVGTVRIQSTARTLNSVMQQAYTKMRSQQKINQSFDTAGYSCAM